MWLVAPESVGEEELPDALSGAGFRLDERLILMGHRGAIHCQINPEARVESVSTFDGMRAYEHGSRRSFYDDATPDDRMVASRASDRWRQQEQGWYRYFVVLYRNRIVGGCYVTLWEDVPTLMGVYTAPEARGQGIATTLLSYVSQGLVQSGRDPYCLFVKDDNPARNLYRSLGFVELSRDETYLSPTGLGR
jgi:GNAT superfamily N-acetyltransferase